MEVEDDGAFVVEAALESRRRPAVMTSVNLA